MTRGNPRLGRRDTEVRKVSHVDRKWSEVLDSRYGPDGVICASFACTQDLQSATASYLEGCRLQTVDARDSPRLNTQVGVFHLSGQPNMRLFSTSQIPRALKARRPLETRENLLPEDVIHVHLRQQHTRAQILVVR